MTVSVIIPSIPPRADLLARAIKSVSAQTRQPAAVHVAIDIGKEGAAFTRDRALAQVETDWVAPLDDDDELYPHHLAALLDYAAADPHADLIYPWFDVIGGTDPFPQFFARPWDADSPHQIPVTMLVRTEIVRDLGGWSHAWDPSFPADTDADGNRAGEDWRLILRMVDTGAKIVHLPVRTWAWHHHDANTSGLPSRW